MVWYGKRPNEYRQKMSEISKKSNKMKDLPSDRHWNWKGGEMYSHGYVLIKQENHPYSNNHGYVREHRLVMEKHLGRYLDPKEVIHHINGVKDDNRIENLELISTQSKHISPHFKKDLSGRKCFLCGGKARIERHPNGKTYEHWHKLDDKFICGRCSSYRRNVLKL